MDFRAGRSVVGEDGKSWPMSQRRSGRRIWPALRCPRTAGFDTSAEAYEGGRGDRDGRDKFERESFPDPVVLAPHQRDERGIAGMKSG